MKECIRKQLLQINQTFYEDFAAAFAATRFGTQPGWNRIIHYFPRRCQVLDIGCGNGRFAHFLDERLDAVQYLGIDSSHRLIAIAQENTAPLNRTQAKFSVVDISEDGWEQSLEKRSFDIVVALAVMHHIPGFSHRQQFLKAAATCLTPNGILILSNWRFTQNPRMRRKIVPWQQIGLSAADVEKGDYLLDWKKEGHGLRYAHQLDETEVSQLAAGAGLQILEQFHADGREGDLSLYSVLSRRRPSDE
ncbi:MAG: class I SAM-dependent methyltransferase [Chloroflexi bacterium]|nr:class I SAM-dependent methyltransferase [Chloroflexota bacterium]